MSVPKLECGQMAPDGSYYRDKGGRLLKNLRDLHAVGRQYVYDEPTRSVCICGGCALSYSCCYGEDKNFYCSGAKEGRWVVATRTLPNGDTVDES